jgi:hypothetical protein
MRASQSRLDRAAKVRVERLHDPGSIAVFDRARRHGISFAPHGGVR